MSRSLGLPDEPELTPSVTVLGWDSYSPTDYTAVTVSSDAADTNILGYLAYRILMSQVFTQGSAPRPSSSTTNSWCHSNSGPSYHPKYLQMPVTMNVSNRACAHPRPTCADPNQTKPTPPPYRSNLKARGSRQHICSLFIRDKDLRDGTPFRVIAVHYVIIVVFIIVIFRTASKSVPTPPIV